VAKDARGFYNKKRKGEKDDMKGHTCAKKIKPYGGETKAPQSRKSICRERAY